MQLKKIKINGLWQQFYFWGNPRKPLFFLLHGWMDTGASFEFLCQSLQKKFYCIACDLRGYGKSEHSKNPLGYFFFEYVADVHRMLEYFSPRQQVNLLGHSLGGFLASIYAGTFPERVKNLINVEGFAFQRRHPRTPPQRVREWIEKLDANRFRVYSTLEALAGRLVEANPNFPLERARFVAKYLAKKVPGGWTIAADPKHKLIDPNAMTSDVRYEFWKNVSASSLFVTAGQKGKLMKDFQKELKREQKFFPSCTQLEAIKESGHMIHHESPEALAGLVENFLGA